MIDKITMKSCATYDSNGISIDDCKKINFIYGSNGSGKSTISNFLDVPADTKFSNCNITWKNNLAQNTVVYNRNFRESNFSTANSTIAGIFTLGEATIEEINSLNTLKLVAEKKETELTGLKKSLEKKNNDILTRENTFRDDIWNAILKKYENIFAPAFTGLRGNKDKFKDNVLLKHKSYSPSIFTIEELTSRATTLYASKPEKINLPAFTKFILKNSLSEIIDEPIWNKIVVGSNSLPISKLINELGNSDWINTGRSYLQEDETCPFCQQKTISDEFKQQVELFFSGEYENDVKLIQSYKQKYVILVSELSNVLSEIEQQDTFFTIGKLNSEEFQCLKANIINLLQINLSSINAKEKEPSHVVSLSDISPDLDKLNNIITITYKNIEAHNNIIDNFKSEQDNLSNDIWNFVLDEQKVLIETYLKDILGQQKGIKSLSDQITQKSLELKTLNNEIIEKGKNITSVQPTVDEINRLLTAYGFENFRIAKAPNQENYYQIQRLDGTEVNNTLSEGEETFISFLYFMQLAKGATEESNISSKKVLVIDDPICSLDSTVLYIVSAMIKDLIHNILSEASDVEQLFILTHNVFFHKEASFVNGGMNPDKNINFWILRKDNNISHIKSHGMDNPIKTSYELLWNELNNNTSASLITIQNIMRRIIENYFNILGSSKLKDDKIIQSFPTPEDQLICKSLLYWINDGSHSIPDDLFIDSYTDSTQKYLDVFKGIFIYTDNEAHYNMMMKIENS